MSVRRLCEIQPKSFAFTPENEAWADRQIAKYPEGRQASAVISLLWRAQAQNHYWLPKPAIEAVAQKLDMPYIRVLEIATFYTMFNLSPVGRFYIQMCGTTPCQLQGSDAIKEVLHRRVGPQTKVTPDGNFSWLEVECLGACCNAPMVQINDDYYEDLTPENFEKLLDDLVAGNPVKTGSQIGRRSSEPVGGLTALATFYGKDGFSGPDCEKPVAVNENERSGARSSETRDEKTTQAPASSEPAHARKEQEAAESAGYPDKDQHTEGRRTDAAPAAGAQKDEGAADEGQADKSVDEPGRKG